jgi:hypothetical protein
MDCKQIHGLKSRSVAPQRLCGQVTTAARYSPSAAALDRRGAGASSASVASVHGSESGHRRLLATGCFRLPRFRPGRFTSEDRRLNCDSTPLVLTTAYGERRTVAWAAFAPWSPSGTGPGHMPCRSTKPVILKGVRKCAAISRFQCSRWLLAAPPPWRRLNRRSPSQQALPIRSPKASPVFRQTEARRIARAGWHPLPRRQRALLRPPPARAARTRVFPRSGNKALRAPPRVERVGFARHRADLPQRARSSRDGDSMGESSATAASNAGKWSNGNSRFQRGLSRRDLRALGRFLSRRLAGSRTQPGSHTRAQMPTRLRHRRLAPKPSFVTEAAPVWASRIAM